MAAKQRGGGLKWVIIFLIAFAAIGGGFWYYNHSKVPAPQFVTVTVGRDSLIQTVTATGTVNPVVDVQVGCQVSGIISKINVDFNSVVKSNEIVAQIDPSTYNAAVEQAQADLDNSRANLELQQIETERSAELFTNNLLSRADYDTAVATLHEAESTVKIKQAVLDTAIANLGYCAIRSPVDGVVISRSVDVGQTVASSFNTPTLFEIANDLTKMQIIPVWPRRMSAELSPASGSISLWMLIPTAPFTAWLSRFEMHRQMPTMLLPMIVWLVSPTPITN